MSTELRDTDSAYGPHSLDAWMEGSVDLIARYESTEVVATMDRAEFIKAVETELNVTVTDKPLPKAEINAEADAVYDDAGGFLSYLGTDPDVLEQVGLRYLAAARALAEHRDAHPPVDEAQVEALAKRIRQEAPGVKEGGFTWDYASDKDKWLAVARRLVEKGVRVQ